MQFGIEIPGLIKWSPIQYRYKYWAGIYQEMGRVINVNQRIWLPSISRQGRDIP